MNQNSISTLYNKSNYLNKSIKYIKNSRIVEYDIKSAGLNILYELKYIDDDVYDYISSMPKKERSIYIGKMLRRNPEMNIALNNGFKHAMEMFIRNNNIVDKDILSIKKDAIYIIDKNIDNLNIQGRLKFVKKKTYDTYINIMNKEHYINISDKILDSKGYTEPIKEHHGKYLLKFLYDIIEKDHLTNDSLKIMSDLAIFKHRLITYDLPIGYYKDIVNDKYLIEMAYTTLMIDNLDDYEDKESINYNTNLKFVLEVINTLI